MMNDVISLVTVLKKTKDADGFDIEENVKNLEVFAEIQSVKRDEYYKAVAAGVKVDMVVVVNEDDYNQNIVLEDGKKKSPSKVIIENVPYRIYRSYRKPEKRTYELTLQEVE